MSEEKHKIPVLLRIKRFKNSEAVNSVNNLLSKIKPARKFRGKPKRILLIRNDRIGDAVATLPAIRNIKINHPEIEIDVLVSAVNKFVFDDFEYIDEVIEFDLAEKSPGFSGKFPLIGPVMNFLFIILPLFVFSAKRRRKFLYLRRKKYDAAVDLVGLKRNLLLSKLISGFSAGPRKFGVYIFYDYYLKFNWVSLNNSDFISREIECLTEGAFGLHFENRINKMPLIKINFSNFNKRSYEIIFHFGTSDLRKLSFEKEMRLIGYFRNRRILVTDKTTSGGFLRLKQYFGQNQNIEFGIFESLKEAAASCRNSGILVCYDGGQAHYLSQFIRTITIFGPGSVALWRPYEFAEYKGILKDRTGVSADMSAGKSGHIAIYLPIWCRPCFDVGCRERPCLKKIEPEFIKNIIEKYCMGNA